MNLSDLESSIAAIEDINALQTKISKIPSRALFYLETMPMGQQRMTEHLNNLKPRYEKLKAEAKPN